MVQESLSRLRSKGCLGDRRTKVRRAAKRARHRVVVGEVPGHPELREVFSELTAAETDDLSRASGEIEDDVDPFRRGDDRAGTRDRRRKQTRFGPDLLEAQAEKEPLCTKLSSQPRKVEAREPVPDIPAGNVHAVVVVPLGRGTTGSWYHWVVVPLGRARSSAPSSMPVQVYVREPPDGMRKSGLANARASLAFRTWSGRSQATVAWRSCLLPVPARVAVRPDA